MKNKDKTPFSKCPNIKPILFSTLMVQGILDGRKTKTRRVAKLQPDGLQLAINNVCRDWNHIFKGYPKDVDIDIWSFGKCPYGEVGDILWVRETFNLHSDLPECGAEYWYKADSKTYPGIRWKPSLFMPKKACRLFLKVKSVRVERLNDISESDAIAEGVDVLEPNEAYKCYDDGAGHFATARGSFTSLWESINGLKSWSANPWVWVIEFERCERPAGFC